MRKKVLPFAQQYYDFARRRAVLETRLTVDVFPAQLPYHLEQLLDLDFMP